MIKKNEHEKAERPLKNEGMSFFKKILGVLFYPDKTMHLIIRKPAYFYPFFFIAILGVIQFFIILPTVNEFIKIEYMALPGQEDTDTILRHALNITKVTGILAGAFGVLAACFLSTVAIWVCGKYLLKKNQEFSLIFSILMFSCMPKVIIGGFINSFSIVISNGLYLKKQSTSLGIFLPTNAEHDFVWALLNTIDFFTVWSIILVSIAMVSLWKISIRQSLTYIGSLWLIYALALSSWASLNI